LTDVAFANVCGKARTFGHPSALEALAGTERPTLPGVYRFWLFVHLGGLLLFVGEGAASPPGA
jgi:hypothetical protein